MRAVDILSFRVLAGLFCFMFGLIGLLFWLTDAGAAFFCHPQGKKGLWLRWRFWMEDTPNNRRKASKALALWFWGLGALAFFGAVLFPTL